jgi:hypothetical protein
MKKTRKLVLNRQVVRQLTEGGLGQVAGGQPIVSDHCTNLSDACTLDNGCTYGGGGICPPRTQLSDCGTFH